MNIYQIMYTTWSGERFSEWKRNMEDASKEKTKLFRIFKVNIRCIDIIKHEDISMNKDSFIRLLTLATPGHQDLLADLDCAKECAKEYAKG